MIEAILLLYIPISLGGAVIARKHLTGLPQKHFRLFAGFFLDLVRMKLVLLP